MVGYTTLLSAVCQGPPFKASVLLGTSKTQVLASGINGAMCEPRTEA